MFVGQNNLKFILMKKLLFIFAVTGLVLTASCTPEAITSDEQQIDKDQYEPDPNG